MDKILYEIIGFFCGYVVILLTPNISPFDIDKLLMRFVVNPFLFFLIMIIFLIGFLAHSVLIKGTIESTYRLVTGQKISLLQTLINYSVFFGYIILFLLGPFEAFFLLVFSTVYGIISVDVKKKTVFEIDR